MENNRKKWLILAGIMIIAVLTAALWWWYNRPLSPEQALQNLPRQMSQLRSYEFQNRAWLEVEGKKQTLSDLKGIKVGQDVHIKGQLLKTPLDYYQVKDKIYLKDPYGRWKEMPPPRAGSQDLIEVLLVSWGLFNWQQGLQATDQVKVTELDGVKCYQITTSPVISNPYLNQAFGQFQGIVWLDQKEGKLYRVGLSGTHKKNPGVKIYINLDFRRHNQITDGIKAPVIP